MFHDYNLTQLRVPKDALPVEGRTYHGRHGYTVFSNNNAAIEVLLKCRAFVVKRVGQGSASADCRKGQLTWSKFDSVAEAWGAAKARGNWQ
ncbi:unnamed protein product [Effrenium voratum]|nr:unnamed protein product [Effrenium voratum]